MPKHWRPVLTWRASQATRTFTMTFLNEARSRNRVYNLERQRRSSRGSLTRMRPTCGHWDFAVRLLLLRAPIPGFAGHITRSSRITAVGTGSTRTTIKTGTILSTTASATLAGTIHLNLVMISSMEVIPLARRLVTMAAPTRLEWHRARNGSAAVTWIRATAHRPGTSSAWNFSSRLIH